MRRLQGRSLVNLFIAMALGVGSAMYIMHPMIKANVKKTRTPAPE